MNVEQMALIWLVRMRQLDGVFFSTTPLMLPDFNPANFRAIAFKPNVDAPPFAHAKVAAFCSDAR